MHMSGCGTDIFEVGSLDFGVQISPLEHLVARHALVLQLLAGLATETNDGGVMALKHESREHRAGRCAVAVADCGSR